jgi:uncharacterized membrane protein
MDQFNSEDQDAYKFGFIYWKKSDKRVVVPKRLPGLGWTLNFANPLSYVFLVILVLIIFLIKWI